MPSPPAVRSSPARRSSGRPAAPKAGRPASRRWPSAITTIGVSGNGNRRHPRRRGARLFGVQADLGRRKIRAPRRDHHWRPLFRGSARLMGTTTPLSDKDRIFTNVYGFQGADLKAAQARGDWDKTADLIKLGPDAIIDIVKASGL